MKKRNARASAVILTSALVIGSTFTPVNADTTSVIDPVKATYGYYVDTAETNTNTSNSAALLDGSLDPSVDASTGLLSQFLELWTPGTVETDDEGNVTSNGWSTGTAVNVDIVQENIQKAHEIAWASWDDEEALTAAYNDDANNQNFSMISGLGEYADAFTESLGITYGNWDPSAGSNLYAIADLVDLARNRTAASTNGAKLYYRFPRPKRWILEDGMWRVVDTNDSLETQVAAITGIVAPSILGNYEGQIYYDEEGNVTGVKDGSSDGGFPSGHTNAATIASYMLAYAVPQQFDDEVMRAAVLGNNRIVVGMHSPLDVMGGRMTGTAVSATALYNDEEGVAKAAYEAAQEYLVSDFAVETADAGTYAEYQENLAQYIYYMTYDFEQIGDTTVAMKVPKGAEVLLRTRLPYMSDEEIRYVLYSTGIESGYPLLDDEEGWGRLNYYAAANGYGSFVTDTTVTMNAEDGGYSAKDNWLNDIDGTGSLTKEGTGELVLAGSNSYSGGTTINGGTITVTNSSALGSGSVNNNSTLSEEVTGAVVVADDYAQGDNAALVLDVTGSEDVMTVAGTAALAGTLTVNVGYNLTADKIQLISANAVSGKFTTVNVNGADGYTLVYEEDGVYLKLAGSLETGNTFTDGEATYKVTTLGSAVQFVSTTAAGSVSVPSTVTYDGVTYKVTSIAASAFQGNKKITKVTIGKNVTTIAAKTFSGCTKLTSVTVGTGVKKIGKKAFYNCKKLKTLTVDSAKLKSVGKQALKGTNKSLTVTVKESKYKAYKKLFGGKGNSTLKVKKA